jgi:hypothetical protein
MFETLDKDKSGTISINEFSLEILGTSFEPLQ